MEIREMKKNVAELIKEAKELNSKEMTEEQRSKFDGKIKEIDELRSSIERAESLAQLEMDNPQDGDPETPEQRKADEKKWNGFGEFLQAVARDARGQGRDKRLVETRQSGLNEGVPSEGGFLVNTDFASELIKKTYENAVLASRARRVPVSANANGLTMNGIDETSRVTGSRYGGVQAYWLHEAGTKTPSMPSFRQIELKLKKLIGLCYATDELLQDAVAMESIMTEAFSEEFGFMVDDSIFRGTGVGQPLGFTGHNATIAVPAEGGQPANTILYENIVNMWSRMYARSRGNAVWLINQDIEPQLFTMSLAVGVGGVPVYMPAGGASASPYGQLMGRPVIPIEQASSLGTVGDITLADMSQYMMIDKGGVQTASSIHVRFVNDEQTFRFVYRCDGQPIWNAALTPANGTNTLSPFVQLETR